VGAYKPDFAPLLSPGRHRLTVSEIRLLCVDKFPGSTIRTAQFAEIERLLSFLSRIKLSCELWINGSFVCAKDDPGDIDIVVAFFSKDAEKLEISIQDDIIKLLNGNKRFSQMLDTFLCPMFDREDTRRGADKSGYWGDLWGKGREGWLKGFIVLAVGETDVQRRLIT
jgi:hypothetical protein